MKKIYLLLFLFVSLLSEAQPVYSGIIAADQTICAGQFPAPLTSVAAATVSSGTIIYQWESSTTSSSAGYSPIVGANSPGYAPGSIAFTTYFRRIAGTSPTNSVVSNVVTVTALPLTALALTGPTAVCIGSTGTFVASTGTSYAWSPSGPNSPTLVATLTNSATVSVTVTLANGCTVSASQQVTVNAVPNMTAAYADTTSCEGLTNTLVAKVSPPQGHTYTWQPGNMTGPSATIIVSNTLTVYTVTATNGYGCKTSSVVTLTVFPLPVITASSSANPVCSGAQATLQASGGISYVWLPGPVVGQTMTVSPTATTVYTVVGFDGTCPNFATVSQSIAAVSPTFVANRDKICIKEFALLTVYGGTAQTWLNPGITATTPSVVVTPTTNTSYSVIITGANSCTAMAVKNISVNACTGISAAYDESLQLNIYPNPNNGEFFITATVATDLKLMNNAGQLIKQVRLSEKNDYKVSVADLAPGIYFVISGSGDQARRQKIVVTK